MTKKEKKEIMRKVVEIRGKPVTFGDNLSSLSIKNGWTYEDLRLYQEIHGETNITADDLIPGFMKNDPYKGVP